LFSCAHPISPGGGPKDKNAPVLLASVPENGSANFKDDRFSLEFDEFVELKDAQNQIMISPPLKKHPEYKTKGKTIQILFKEDLKENTTYSVYFGDAIVDITEGNPLSNFTYIFSTGPFVDSLSLQGTVFNAFDLKAVEDCFVMLYKDDNDTVTLDSMPYLLRPYYLSKTDKRGRFKFNGLGNYDYLMFAIKDMNASLSYDQPNEEIAFVDSLVRPEYIPTMTDTTLSDSAVSLSSDSLVEVIDTANIKKTRFFNDGIRKYEMFLFTEKDKKLKLLSSKMIRDNTLRFVFNLPADRLSVSPLNIPDREIWYHSVHSPEFDTITWYFKNMDSDTLAVLIKQEADTLEYLNIRLKNPLARGRKNKNEKVKRITYDKIPAKNLLPGQMPQIEFHQPIEIINLDSAVLISGEDTIISPEYRFLDSLRMLLEFKIENVEGSRYTLLIPDSLIYDWNTLTNDEIIINYNTKQLSDYGQISLKISNVDKQSIIIQLLNNNEDVVARDVISGDTLLVYKYLDAEKFKFKAIFDSNENGKWDAGDYATKTQAEKVRYFKKELEVRANWEIEEDWELKKPQ
jgi:hypothetical protein